MSKRFETGSITTWNGGRTNTISVTINSNPSEVSAKSIVDCLNEHMPKPKKTLEYFMGLSNNELDEIISSEWQHNLAHKNYSKRVDLCYHVLRPEMKELEYYVDVYRHSEDTKFQLISTSVEATIYESIQHPPARIYTIFYLLVKELTR